MMNHGGRAAWSACRVAFGGRPCWAARTRAPGGHEPGCARDHGAAKRLVAQPRRAAPVACANALVPVRRGASPAGGRAAGSGSEGTAATVEAATGHEEHRGETLPWRCRARVPNAWLEAVERVGEPNAEVYGPHRGCCLTKIGHHVHPTDAWPPKSTLSNLGLPLPSVLERICSRFQWPKNSADER